MAPVTMKRPNPPRGFGLSRCARLLHNPVFVRLSFRLVLAGLITIWAFGPSTVITSAADDTAAPDAAALHEMLEGASGARQVWGQVPELVVLSSVMEFTSTNLAAGHTATGDTLRAAEVTQLATDLTNAVSIFTGGRISAFAAIRTEAVEPGQSITLLRAGQIVVGRFRGVQAKSGTLGYGGRMMRRGAIAAGAVMLDADFDRQAKGSQLLRTHELGHALGYNHVQSRRSVMNPRVGPEVTDFDRQAIELAYAAFSLPSPTAVLARN